MSASSHFHRVLVIDDTPAIYEDFRKILAPAVEAVDAAGADLAQLWRGGDPGARSVVSGGWGAARRGRA